MKILFEICHPAHVHYFRNLINEYSKKGHQVKIIAQNRGIIAELLDKYKLEYSLFPNLPKNIWGKLLFIPFIDLIFYRHALKFKPDMLIGFGGAYISHVGWLIGKPSIVLDDTDIASMSHAAYKKIATVILSPNCFTKDFGPRHLKFDSYMELSYLHANYLSLENVLDKKPGTTRKTVLLRFVSWRAHHDVGQNGISDDLKFQLVAELKNDYDIIISSEETLPESLAQYQYKFPADKMHSLLSSIDLFIGEGATMASECVMLGTPAVYVNSLQCTTLLEQEKKYGLVSNFPNSIGVIEKVKEILNTPNLK
jgi:predicted glycosyltransferase